MIAQTGYHQTRRYPLYVNRKGYTDTGEIVKSFECPYGAEVVTPVAHDMNSDFGIRVRRSKFDRRRFEDARQEPVLIAILSNVSTY